MHSMAGAVPFRHVRRLLRFYLIFPSRQPDSGSTVRRDLSLKDSMATQRPATASATRAIAMTGGGLLELEFHNLD